MARPNWQGLKLFLGEISFGKNPTKFSYLRVKRKKSGEVMQDTTSDEIDLIELINVLWSGKWLIAGISALITTPVFAYLLFIFEPPYRASIEILPLNAGQMRAYDRLNSLLASPLSADGFKNIVYSELYSGDTLRNLISENDPRLIDFDGSPQERAILLREIVSKAIEAAITTKKDTVVRPDTISFTGPDEATTISLLTKLLGGLEQKALTSLVESIETIIQNERESRDFAIQKAEIEIENLIDNYATKIAARVKFLQEQLEIARTLGIAENGFSDLLSKGSITGISGQNSLPFYMRGYKAIGKELALIKARGRSREEMLQHISEYPALRAKLISLETDPTIQRIETAFEASPLKERKTKIINYNTAAIDGKSTSSKVLILALTIIVSGIIGVVVVLLRSFTTARQETDAA